MNISLFLINILCAVWRKQMLRKYTVVAAGRGL